MEKNIMHIIPNRARITDFGGFALSARRRPG